MPNLIKLILADNPVWGGSGSPNISTELAGSSKPLPPPRPPRPPRMSLRVTGSRVVVMPHTLVSSVVLFLSFALFPHFCVLISKIPILLYAHLCRIKCHRCECWFHTLLSI